MLEKVISVFKDNPSFWLFLVYNHGRYKHQLLDQINKRSDLLKNTDSSFHEEIESQFSSVVRSFIVDDVTKSLGISTEDALICIECVDIKSYLLEH
jgi:hypothetical protein